MSCRRAFEIDLAAFLADSRASGFEDFRDHYPRCGECSAEVRAWTEVEALLRAPGVEAHPDPGALLRFADGELAAADHAALASHLDGCAMCRDELRALGDFDPAMLLATSPAAPVEAESGRERTPWWEALRRLVAHPAFAYALVLVVAAPTLWRLLGPGGEAQTFVARESLDRIATAERDAPLRRQVAPAKEKRGEIHAAKGDDAEQERLGAEGYAALEESDPADHALRQGAGREEEAVADTMAAGRAAAPRPALREEAKQRPAAPPAPAAAPPPAPSAESAPARARASRPAERDVRAQAAERDIRAEAAERDMQTQPSPRAEAALADEVVAEPVPVGEPETRRLKSLGYLVAGSTLPFERRADGGLVGRVPLLAGRGTSEVRLVSPDARRTLLEQPLPQATQVVFEVPADWVSPGLWRVERRTGALTDTFQVSVPAD